MKIIHIHRGEQVRLFNTIAIETSSLCNRTCVFCPNHEFARIDELMAWSLIEKITDDLVDAQFRGRISPYIYNEPLRDPRCLEIYEYWRRRLPKASIAINTNCDYIKSTEDIERLFDAGVNQLMLNIYSQADGDPDPEKVERGIAAAERRGDQIQAMLDEVECVDQVSSLYAQCSSSVRRAQVCRKFGHHFESGFTLQNRSGFIPSFAEATSGPLKKSCTRPFRALQINWRGDAILCCNDYYGQVRGGNVRHQSVVEIWNSETFNIYRLKLQNRDRRIFLCDTCDFSGGPYPHMVSLVTFGDERDNELLNADLSESTCDVTIEGKKRKEKKRR